MDRERSTGQADAADSLVEQGKTITVTVAKAPAPPPSPTPTPTPSKTTSKEGASLNGFLTVVLPDQCLLRGPVPVGRQCLMSGLRSAARSAAPAMPSDSSQLPSIW